MTCLVEIWWVSESETENLRDKLVGISLRRRDQLKPNVVWGVLAKVIQSNSRFALSDRLEVHLDHVKELKRRRGLSLM